MKKMIRFPSADETKKRRMITQMKCLISEGEDYLATHPNASMVREELKRLRADLADLRAQVRILASFILAGPGHTR
jgi:cob(I)alamin adenosyltransferase